MSFTISFAEISRSFVSSLKNDGEKLLCVTNVYLSFLSPKVLQWNGDKCFCSCLLLFNGEHKIQVLLLHNRTN